MREGDRSKLRLVYDGGRPFSPGVCQESSELPVGSGWLSQGWGYDVVVVKQGLTIFGQGNFILFMARTFDDKL